MSDPLIPLTLYGSPDGLSRKSPTTPEEINTILSAAEHFASVLSADFDLAGELGTQLTCTELEALASFLEATGRPNAAEFWREAHAEGDDAGDDHYQGDEEADQ